MQIIGEPIVNVNRLTYVNLKDNKGMIFGERLKQRREELGLSQGELAVKVGIKQPSVAEAEAIGKSSKKILEYAKALECNPEWLATGKGSKLLLQVTDHKVLMVENELERQLLMFYREISHEHQDDVMSLASLLHNIDGPKNRNSNPYPNKPTQKEKL